MIILGIDPGTATTGYGLIKRSKKPPKRGEYINFECLEYGLIKTSPKFSPAERLHQINKELNKIIRLHQPTIMAVERLFFFKNLKTAMPVSQAKGVILMTAAKKKMPIYEFTPPQMKMAIAGYGRAEKDHIQETIKTLLNLDEIPKPDDAADALGIAICCALNIEI